MVAFKKFFSSVFLAVVYASAATAAPWEATSKHATHRTRSVGKRGLTFSTFNPASTYETFGEGVAHPLMKRAEATLKDSAVEYVKEKLGVNTDSVEYKSGYSTSTGSFAYIKQKHDGIEFANSVANIAFKDDRVVAFGSSFVKPKKIASSKPKVAVKDAISTAEQALEGKYNDHPTKLEYLVKEDGSAALAHVVQIQNQEDFTWYEAFVDAQTGEVLSVVDFVNDATFRALPISKEYPTAGFETLTNPEDTTASPNGWLNDGTTTYTNTQGNNIISYKSSTSGTSAQTSSGSFVYTWNSAASPTTSPNIDVARVNAFYLGNTIHDIAYRYGFTESAYNFQKNNLGKGGAANDRVQISVQDSSGTNNANFATPPDGQSGQMRMFLWTLTSPQRDGAIENDIIIHEYTHGITNRMTGGGTGRCLQTTESGGMGEGWGDAFADWNAQSSATLKDFDMGVFVYTKNIRSRPYSTSATTNNLRYSSIKALNEVHNIGEVWANMLHNVHAAFTAQYGFSSSARTNPNGTEGNIKFLHLFIDSLALQPCNPTFTQARDAWVQADANRYGGANKCLIWKAFASRGLGVGASGYTDSSSVPSGC